MPIMTILLTVIGVCLAAGGILLAYGIQHAPVGEETAEGFREIAPARDRSTPLAVSGSSVPAPRAP